MLADGDHELVWEKGTWRIMRETYWGDYELWHSRCQSEGYLEWEEVEEGRCSECKVKILKAALINFKLLKMGS
jgi:hypothetical protein